MEMNSFLDPILECVINHGGERAIVFSSFNPDICTMYVGQSNKQCPQTKNDHPGFFISRTDTRSYC